VSKIKKGVKWKNEKQAAIIINGCQTAKKNKNAPLSVLHVKVRLHCCAVVRAAIRHRHSWCCWVLVLVAASWGCAGAGRCFAGLYCCRSSLLVAVGCGGGVVLLFCFCVRGCCAFAIYYQVRLSHVSPTPIAKKNKKDRYFAFFAMTRHDVAIHNPQRHRYSVTFFQNSIMLFRHGRHLITLLLLDTFFVLAKCVFCFSSLKYFK